MLSTLSIYGFSCLKDVHFETRPVVAIIGPQGSGKSVMTKLQYFMSDVLREHLTSAERGDSFEDFKRVLAKKFRIWFPPAAWGNKRFNISYSSGDFSIRILRRMRNSRLSDELAITFCDWFGEFYANSRESYEQIKEQAYNEELFNDDPRAVTNPIEDAYRLRNQLRGRIIRRLGSHYVDSQTFIPAGRAFFTSIGKLVAGIQNVGALDPLTIDFAERFSELRSRNASMRSPLRLRRLGSDFMDRDKKFGNKFFGGEVVYQAGAEHVKATDGREIPFNALSSGQQEILPMWTMVQYLAEIDAMRASNLPQTARREALRRREILYIEEPEAHLFPEAQSDFLRYLFESLEFGPRSKTLIMTTHSPYIMGRLNVFLKAGALSRRKKKNTEINEVVPRSRWIKPSEFAAFAMVDGSAINIVDEDGIIDASYLDSISSDIAEDFDRLLDIEMSI